MVWVVAVDKVLHDGAALEQVDGLAVCERIRQGRNASVGVDLEKPWLLRFPNITILVFAHNKDSMPEAVTFCVFLLISMAVVCHGVSLIQELLKTQSSTRLVL